MSTDPHKEAKWIASAQAGDRFAFGELVRAHWESTVNFIFRYTGDLPLAEETSQEAFLRAWKSLASYRAGHPFRGWIFRIAMNIAIDQLRQARPAQDIEQIQLASRLPGPEESVENQELTQQVRRAVLALPDATRAVLILREYEGLSYQEISEVLHIPIGTVMSRLNSARSKLRQELIQEVTA